MQKIYFFYFIWFVNIYKQRQEMESKGREIFYLFCFLIKMKIDFAVEKYLKYRKFVEKITTNTLKLHRGALTRFVQFLFVQRSEIPDLDEIWLDDVIEYCEFLETAEFSRWRGYWKKIHLSHNTQVTHQHCIQGFFKRCYVSRLMNAEIYHIPIAKFKKTELSYLSHDEVEQFFEITKTSRDPVKRVRDELLFRIAYFTGLRKTEILNLTFDQILEDGQFQIQWKMDRKRTVFFDSESKIRELALELKYLYIKNENKRRVQEEKDYVFLITAWQSRWRKLWRGWVFVLLDDYKRKLWISRRLTLHSFRHTFATTLLNNWADLREVQLLLWHQSLNSTQVYTHISLDKLKGCAALLHL